MLSAICPSTSVPASFQTLDLLEECWNTYSKVWRDGGMPILMLEGWWDAYSNVGGMVGCLFLRLEGWWDACSKAVVIV